MFTVERLKPNLLQLASSGPEHAATAVWRTLQVFRGWGVNIQRVKRLTLFLTFGVFALNQVRIPDLNVEGFVLLVLLVVNYFHFDGFTEEGRRKENKERAEEKRRKNSEGRTHRRLEKEKVGEKKNTNILHKHVRRLFCILGFLYFHLGYLIQV